MKFNSNLIFLNAIGVLFLICFSLPQAEACKKKKAAAPPAPGVIKDYIQQYQQQVSDLQAQQQPESAPSQQRSLDAPAAAPAEAPLSQEAIAKKIKKIQGYIEQWKAILVKSEAYYKAKEEKAKAAAEKAKAKAEKQARRRGEVPQPATTNSSAKASDSGVEGEEPSKAQDAENGLWELPNSPGEEEEDHDHDHDHEEEDNKKETEKKPEATNHKEPEATNHKQPQQNENESHVNVHPKLAAVSESVANNKKKEQEVPSEKTEAKPEAKPVAKKGRAG